MHGLMDASDAARWQRGAAASLVSIRPGQGYDFAYPTKVLAALACGVPVVYAGVGPVIEDLTAHDLGWVADYTEDDVARAMTRALDEADRIAAQDTSRARRLHAWVRDHRSLRATGEAVARHLRTVVRGA